MKCDRVSFMRTTPRGHPAAVRVMALKLYASEVSMNRTGQFVGASTWPTRPIPTGSSVTFEREAVKRIRHWYARFCRRSIVVSRSARMIEVTLAIQVFMDHHDGRLDSLSLLA